MTRSTFAMVLGAALLTVGAAKGGDLSRMMDPNRLPVPPAPKPEDRIIFPHAFHVVDMETECSVCHEGVEEATSIRQTDLPPMETCGNCHDIESAENCGLCHTNAEEPSATAKHWTDDIHFSHQAHMAREGVDCKTCHAAAWTSNSAEDRLSPQHPTCNTCHQKDMNRLACGTCHERMTELGRSPTDTMVHGSNFFAMHDAWAVGNSAACAQCHDQSYCSDCHARTNPVPPSLKMPAKVDREFIHRGDFISRHALESAARPGTCVSCHGQSFCSDCHDKALGTDSNGTSFSRSPHPPGYVVRGGAFHGTDARLNVQQCAACHDRGAASNCVDCHRVGGVGGNPHPPGWDRDDGRTSNPACVACHNGG